MLAKRPKMELCHSSFFPESVEITGFSDTIRGNGVTFQTFNDDPTSMTPRTFMLCTVRKICAIFLLLLMLSTASAEQIVIDENSEDRAVAGDFLCSPCYNPILGDADTVNIASGQMTTGQLYQYFQSRGISRVNKLSFQVDVDCDPDNDRSIALTDLSFEIQDAANNLVTRAGFGDTELLLDKSEITSFKPEAVLEFDLGYDFMQRFSSDSKEAILLNFSSPDTTDEMKPRIVLASEMSSFSSSNLVRIGGFITFWGIVFLGAHLVTRRVRNVNGAQLPLRRPASTGHTVV